ncbi:NADH-quinone oxidoreductase subunit J OS=Tsukamurella paurometabola (strain ATCC 8368 / DSM/ CCUG 35730 / CIP 100753 / JCM 10117 / KCTC 9821 / NBRC 16120/ NCIMB 702349 / NCTC 13040) OX=521096 GN=Tpau_3177 PE=3 SV=1 [Tsukamurella paurometabola]|uniref:NADH-quinone oxidoreductase subunit J n=1 Tax=Tsukamurella paurometabola (strain ATCC 8368 / DSM 20162 / CCUG 35730 / CIP 100753 / JCM 10117 / KCTC 9821 / NBRC 16120 / NCIMB 702349 / NCTC 13040) TaxID=521096 RepID=D5UVI2_TSUPD|nr:NADH-quinone oxidoreductase subunit J [Tsukamurella paurometabola]ADG79764.1 NADH-ubiquinone/plastoquinone oxidoreductase chain 6 [Tsukamurella paurometabola DSM 20162]SUP37111.1 NADH-quinone oxidoreductase subunit J [Tsukamurella paurometabola]
MTGEEVAFWVVAVPAVLFALGVVVASKAVYSALCLAATMILLAVAYLSQGAMFLGVVQVVVYTGAVMMLFLFVVMLVGVDSSDSLVETLRGHRVAAAVAGTGFGLLLVTLLARAVLPVPRPVDGVAPQYPPNSVEALADTVFVRYVWAFELTAALLITATLGAMILAHREKLTAPLSQREQSILRFREGRRATPLPNPGVYARGNAVDLPALLPDGSPAPDSVNRTLTPRTPGQRRELPGRGRTLDDDPVTSEVAP